MTLQQKLSPQQIQMIKLLELPTVQLEQRIKQEIEENIVLEEDDHTPEDEQPQQISVEEYLREDETPSYKSRITIIRRRQTAPGPPCGRTFVAGVPGRTVGIPQSLGAGYASGRLSGRQYRGGRLSAPEFGGYRRRHRLHAGRRCFGRALGTIAVDYPRTRTDRCRCPQPAGVFIVAIGSGES